MEIFFNEEEIYEFPTPTPPNISIWLSVCPTVSLLYYNFLLQQSDEDFQSLADQSVGRSVFHVLSYLIFCLDNEPDNSRQNWPIS